NHRIRAAVHQLVHQQVRDSLADILIRAKDRSYAALHRRVVEVHDRHSLLLLGRQRRGSDGQGGNHEAHSLHLLTSIFYTLPQFARNSTISKALQYHQYWSIVLYESAHINQSL